MKRPKDDDSSVPLATLGPARARGPRNARRPFHRFRARYPLVRTAVGAVGLHDLRHTGSTWSSQTGATLKEVMARIGHSSTRAAMIYQHATRDRDQAIAAALDALIEDAVPRSRHDLACIWHNAKIRTCTTNALAQWTCSLARAFAWVEPRGLEPLTPTLPARGIET